MKTYCFIHVLKKPTRCANKYIYVIDPLSFMLQILKTVVSFDYRHITEQPVYQNYISHLHVAFHHSNVDTLEIIVASPLCFYSLSKFLGQIKVCRRSKELRVPLDLNHMQDSEAMRNI